MKKYFYVLIVTILSVPCHAIGTCDVRGYDFSNTIEETGCSNPAPSVTITSEDGSTTVMYMCHLAASCNDGYEKLPHPEYRELCMDENYTTCGKIVADWAEDTVRHVISRSYEVTQNNETTTYVDCRCSQGYYGVTRYNKALKRCSSTCSPCPWHEFGGAQATTMSPIDDLRHNLIVQDCFVEPGAYYDTSGAFEMLEVCYYAE